MPNKQDSKLQNCQHGVHVEFLPYFVSTFGYVARMFILLPTKQHICKPLYVNAASQSRKFSGAKKLFFIPNIYIKKCERYFEIKPISKKNHINYEHLCKVNLQRLLQNEIIKNCI